MRVLLCLWYRRPSFGTERIIKAEVVVKMTRYFLLIIIMACNELAFSMPNGGLWDCGSMFWDAPGPSVRWPDMPNPVKVPYLVIDKERIKSGIRLVRYKGGTPVRFRVPGTDISLSGEFLRKIAVNRYDTVKRGEEVYLVRVHINQSNLKVNVDANKLLFAPESALRSPTEYQVPRREFVLSGDVVGQATLTSGGQSEKVSLIRLELGPNASSSSENFAVAALFGHLIGIGGPNSMFTFISLNDIIAVQETRKVIDDKVDNTSAEEIAKNGWTTRTQFEEEIRQDSELAPATAFDHGGIVPNSPN